MISMLQLWIVAQVRRAAVFLSPLLTRSRSLGCRDTINVVRIHFNYGE